jgi:GTP-binding protein EngB required for normal cell division
VNLPGFGFVRVGRDLDIHVFNDNYTHFLRSEKKLKSGRIHGVSLIALRMALCR